MDTICVWSDSTWCYLNDLEEYSWMSDDYVLVKCPEGQEDAVAKEVNSKNYLYTSNTIWLQDRVLC